MPPTLYATVKKYIYLGNGVATLTLNTTLSGVVENTVLYINDPTYLSVDTATGKFNLVDPYIFVPGGFPGSNSYNNFIISNDTKNEYRQTTSYNGITKLVGISTAGSAVSTRTTGPIDNWDDTDIIIIRGTPVLSLFVSSPLAENFTTNAVVPGGILTPANALINELSTSVFQTEDADALSVPQVGNFLEKSPYYNVLMNLEIVSLTLISYVYDVGTEKSFTIPNYFAGAEILCFESAVTVPELNNQIRTVKNSYYKDVGGTGTIFLELEEPLSDSTPSSITAGTTFNCTVTIPSEFSRIVKYENIVAPAGSNSNVQFIEFPYQASDIPDYYRTLYIKVTTGGVTETRIISEYIVEKNQFNNPILLGAVLNSPLLNTPDATTTFSIKSGIVNPPFKNYIADSDPMTTDQKNRISYSLLPFSYDGFNPFVYSGSMISQQEQVCYSIELKNLILPNQVLDGGFGSLIPFYPYIYVEFQNISAPGSGLNNVIYSNNPNATKMMFRVPITDVPNPVNSTFIKLDSRGVVQTLKFKPNDNLKFGVYLSDGTQFKTLIKDTKPPLKPDPLVQISAIFAIKRID